MANSPAAIEPVEGAAFASWAGCGPGTKKGKAKRNGPPSKKSQGRANLARATEELKAILEDAKMNEEAWEDAPARTFVALYAWLHEEVYGVAPEELAENWTPVVGMASRMLHTEFDAKPLRMVAFMKWVWANERGRERQRGASDTFRIGWRYQFGGGTLLTSYRVYMTRAGRASKG